MFTFMPRLRTRYLTRTVMCLRIALIGGTIEALVLAHHLLEKNDVIIIEMEAELGLPVNHPGRVIDPNILNTYFTSEQQTFLALQPNSDGWGCRWDWIMKHLAANIARHGVQFLTRTRVLSSTKTNQTIHLELTSTERDQPTLLTVDRLVLTESSDKRGPGNRQHSLSPHPPMRLSFPATFPWFGGTVVSEDATSAPGPNLCLSRGDGMTELWWHDRPLWSPSRGFIEQCTPHLSENLEDLSFDGAVLRALEQLPTFV